MEQTSHWTAVIPPRTLLEKPSTNSHPNPSLKESTPKLDMINQTNLAFPKGYGVIGNPLYIYGVIKDEEEDEQLTSSLVFPMRTPAAHISRRAQQQSTTRTLSEGDLPYPEGDQC